MLWFDTLVPLLISYGLDTAFGVLVLPLETAFGNNPRLPVYGWGPMGPLLIDAFIFAYIPIPFSGHIPVCGYCFRVLVYG